MARRKKVGYDLLPCLDDGDIGQQIFSSSRLSDDIVAKFPGNGLGVLGKELFAWPELRYLY